MMSHLKAYDRFSYDWRVSFIFLFGDKLSLILCHIHMLLALSREIKRILTLLISLFAN